MRALLAELGDPQLAVPAVHVVGTNGKSTTTRLTEALLTDGGLTVGAYRSPHVGGWSERIRIGGAEADFERLLEGVRPRVMAARATQFEALTAAALLGFAEAGVDVAVVEAGLRGGGGPTEIPSPPAGLPTERGAPPNGASRPNPPAGSTGGPTRAPSR